MKIKTNFQSRFMLRLALLAVSVVCLPQKAFAYDWMVEVNVVAIEPSYVPTNIGFMVDASAGSCAAGAWLNWVAKGADQPAKIANVQAVLAVLMTAMAGAKKVRLYGNNAGCTIDYIHAL